ncbi:MAG: hypothetical protein MJ236_04350 [Clostridia bacterium]|nr:hypothetical protein [Clostridia bacterium]
MLTIENIRNIKYKGKVVEVYKKILQVDESGKILCTFENDSHELNENKTDFIWVHKEETIEVKFTDFEGVFFYKPTLLSKGWISFFKERAGESIYINTSNGIEDNLSFQITREQKDTMYKI